MKTSTDIEFPTRPLVVLGATTFVVVTGEMLPTAVLVHMSTDLGVPEAQTGLLVSLWALTVALTSYPLVRATARWDRRRVVVGALVVFAASAVGTALAGTFAVALATRLVGAAATGLLWAAVNAHSAALVPERLLARAVTIVIGGATLGTVIGVPAANLLARLLDWRVASGAVALVALAVAAAVAALVPDGLDQRAVGRATGGAGDGRRLVPVLGLAGAIGVALVGHFAAFTFVTAVFEQAAPGVPGGMSGLLLLLGAVSALAVVAVGVVGDARPGAALLAATGLTGVALAAVALGAGRRPGTTLAVVALWGFASGALPPLAQTMIMRLAGPGLRDAAGAVVPVMFNLSIAAGAAAGSGVVGAWGPDALAGPAAAVVVAGTAGIAVVRRRAARRDDPVGPSTRQVPTGMLSA